MLTAGFPTVAAAGGYLAGRGGSSAVVTRPAVHPLRVEARRNETISWGVIFPRAMRRPSQARVQAAVLVGFPWIRTIQPLPSVASLIASKRAPGLSEANEPLRPRGPGCGAVRRTAMGCSRLSAS